MTFEELVGEGIGEASMCWSEIPSGVFDSSKAKEINDKILDEFYKLKAQLNMAENKTAELAIYNHGLKEKLAVAVEALEFYADTSNYACLECEYDGKEAKEALEKLK